MELSIGIRRGRGRGAALLMRGGEGGKKTALCVGSPAVADGMWKSFVQPGFRAQPPRARQCVSLLVRNLQSVFHG